MKRAVAVIVGVALVCLVAYLSWLNPGAVEFRFSPTRSVQAPLAALLVLAFVVGAVAVLSVVMVQAGRRAFASWRRGRHERRIERIEDWEQRGEQLVWAGDTQGGRALLHKAWQRRPESARAVLALATSYRDTGELQRARLLLSEAATHHHTDPDVLLALADAHRAAGDHAGCVDVLERLRALHPSAPRALLALRDRYVEAARWREAVSLQEALLVEIRDGEQGARERDYLTHLRYQAALGLPESERLAALESLAEGRAATVPILVSLGDALLAASHGDEASVIWERALRQTPRTVLVERLEAIATEERHRERLRQLLRRLRIDQIHGDNLRLHVAQLCISDGQLDDAARELEACGQSPHAQRLWAEVYRRRGQQERAVTAYAQAGSAATTYQCQVCQRAADTWIGYCPQCGSWDTYRSGVEIGAT